ncbi:DUF6965 family protein [Pedobacter albus]|uniref:DUF6965 family protein n=1 Tax=Pedobacter albus TaxID=3113905 RepID=UPI003D66F824
MDILQLEEYFNSIELPEGPFKLNDSAVIENVPSFLNSHFGPLRKDPTSRVNQPLIWRLLELKAGIESMQ